MPEGRSAAAAARRLLNFIKAHFIAIFGVLAAIFGVLAAIGFGVVTVLAYIDQKKGLEEARTANILALEALEVARNANSNAYYQYELNKAQFIWDQMQNCRDTPSLTGLSSAITSACSTIASWTWYPSEIPRYFTPTAVGVSSNVPTPAPTQSLQGYLQTAQNEIAQEAPVPTGVAAGILFGPPGIIVLLMLALGAYLICTRQNAGTRQEEVPLDDTSR